MNSYVLSVVHCDRFDDRGLVFWHCDITKVLGFVTAENGMSVVTEGCHFARTLDDTDFLLNADTTFSSSKITIQQIYDSTHRWVDCQVLPELSALSCGFIAVLKENEVGRLKFSQSDLAKGYLKHLLFDVIAEFDELLEIYDKKSHMWNDLRVGKYHYADLQYKEQYCPDISEKLKVANDGR
jgi:hypothetical protein